MSDAPRDGPAAPAGGTLRRRGLVMTAWSIGGTVVQRSSSLVSNLVMTRLLAPEAFGLMAMVVTVLMMAEMVSDIGIRQSVVRSERGEDLRFLRIAWTVQAMRALVVAAVVLAAAGAVAVLGPALAPADSVYADPVLPALIAVASLAVIFRGLTSTAAFRAMRRLDVGRLTMSEVVVQIVVLVAMVTVALTVGATVWVLLFGLLAGFALQAAASHLIFPDAPMRPAWDRETAAEMWRFGRWIIAASMAGFLVNSGDRLILGALLDAQTFGLYAIATIWLQAGLGVVDKLAGGPVLSALAETLRGARDAFPRVLARVRMAFDGILLAAFLAAFALSGPLMELLYTPEYLGAAPILALLSLRFLAVRQRPLNALLVAEGHSATSAAAGWSGAAAMLVAVPAVWHLAGPAATFVAVALVPLAGAPVLIAGAARAIPGLPLRRDAVVVAAILALAAAVLAWGGWDGSGWGGAA